MSARPTSEVQEEATNIASKLKAMLAATPHEDTVGIPSDRERIWQVRRTLTGIISELTQPFEGRLVKVERRLAERREWHQLLAACRAELEPELAKYDGVNFRMEEALRGSLLIIRDGAGAADEFFATPLLKWLSAHGVRPEPGAQSFFSGRGGLLSTETEIAELEKELGQIIAQVESSLTFAKQFIGTSAGVEQTPAQAV